ncbi:hypothetical protein ACFLQT_01430 [Bacteroidota bacterium]
MELIPILSLIILVATVSTFILAVGAYILYKIRERKGTLAQSAQPAAIPAELVAPAPMAAEQRPTQPGAQKTYTGEFYPARDAGQEYQPQYGQYSDSRQQPGPEMRPTYVTQSGYSEARYERPVTDSMSEREKSATKRKFMRYTRDGYVEPSSEDKPKEDNLKWR